MTESLLSGFPFAVGDAVRQVSTGFIGTVWELSANTSGGQFVALLLDARVDPRLVPGAQFVQNVPTAITPLIPVADIESWS